MKFILWAISSHLKEIALLNRLCCFLYVIIRKRNELFRIVLQGLRTKQYG